MGVTKPWLRLSSGILAACESAIPINVSAGTTIRADPCHKEPLILVLASYRYDFRLSMIAVNPFVDQRSPGYRISRCRPRYRGPLCERRNRCMPASSLGSRIRPGQTSSADRCARLGRASRIRCRILRKQPPLISLKKSVHVAARRLSKLRQHRTAIEIDHSVLVWLAAGGHLHC
jgi:hypothetical protein